MDVFMKVGKKRLIGMVAVSVIAITTVILLLASNFNKTSMLPELRDVFTLYDAYNMTVVVTFDAEPPIVQFISPNGSHIDMENIRYRTGSNFVQYFLPNAMPGVWRMAYNPLTNTEINTPYSVYMEHIFIQTFDADIEMINDRGVSISFKVSADDAGEFNYELHAILTAADNSITEEILLIKGYGMLNELLILAANIGDIMDIGGFMLRLTAYVQYGQAAIRDTAWLDLRLHAKTQ